MQPLLRIFALADLILELCYCAFGDFSQQIVLHRLLKKFCQWGPLRFSRNFFLQTHHYVGNSWFIDLRADLNR